MSPRLSAMHVCFCCVQCIDSGLVNTPELQDKSHSGNIRMSQKTEDLKQVWMCIALFASIIHNSEKDDGVYIIIIWQKYYIIILWHGLIYRTGFIDQVLETNLETAQIQVKLK